MTTKPDFKICGNCGAVAPLSRRFCNNPNGCGPVDRHTRRLSKGSVWRKPTDEEIAADVAKSERRKALFDELLKRADEEDAMASQQIAA